MAAVAAAVCALLAPAATNAAVGDRLDLFTPSPSGNGRGITMKGNSTTAYYSTAGGEDKVYLVNLKTHANAGTLDTNLEGLAPSRSFGTLAWDQGRGVLWGSEYSPTDGYIDRVDPSTGAVTRVFNARADDAFNTGIDGLAVDRDGSLWTSADGLGIASITVYHYSAAGAVLGTFTSPFNSGIAVDGDDLWLADIDNRTIRKYTKAGAFTGVSFPTTDIDPESLTVDNCSFAGKKALWTYSAAFAGAQMAAYEIGTSTNAGCPADGGTPGSIPDGPTGITIPEKTVVVAGRVIVLDATSVADPQGTIFVYVWVFGDGTKQVRGGGRIKHRYRCAGTYKVKVTVIDTSGASTTLTRTLGVAFPKSATKKFRNLRMSPRVRIRGRRVRASLVVKRRRGRGRMGKRKRARIKNVDYRIDRKRYRRKRPSPGARTRVRRKRRHTLVVKVRFRGTRKTRRIKACFYA